MKIPPGVLWLGLRQLRPSPTRVAAAEVPTRHVPWTILGPSALSASANSSTVFPTPCATRPVLHLISGGIPFPTSSSIRNIPACSQCPSLPPLQSATYHILVTGDCSKPIRRTDVHMAPFRPIMSSSSRQML
jgi:hypothetical protein